MNREELNNAGNNRGVDVRCNKCGEPWEDAYIVEDFTQHELDKYVVLGSHLDDPDGDEKTFIIGLSGCPSCC